MLLRYDFFNMEFLGPTRFLKKIIHSNFLNHAYHVGVRKIKQKFIYIKYSLCTQVLVLLIKDCQLFIKCMCGVTH